MKLVSQTYKDTILCKKQIFSVVSQKNIKNSIDKMKIALELLRNSCEKRENGVMVNIDPLK